MELQQCAIAVIGGGPAGMAAAVAAYDRGVRDIVILDREPRLGGILQQCIHNGFGLHRFGKEMTGPEYAAAYEQMVAQRNITVLYETTVTEILPDKTVVAQSRQGMIKLQARAIVLAMGCRERSRGALNIPGERPAGVYSAGTAQKLINCYGYQVGKRVVILGSGDIGLIMARRLSLEGAKVEAVCELLPFSGGLKRNIVQCLEDFDIPLYLSTTVVQVHGRGRLEGVTVAQVDENRKVLEHTQRYIPCDTLLLSVGLIPENELTVAAGVEMDGITAGARVDENCQTSIPGIFACGNVLQVHDLVDYVSQEANRAGTAAADYAMGNCPREGVCATTAAGKGVRYVIPQTVRSVQQDVPVFFRVSQPAENVKIVVSCQDQVLASVNKQAVAPGEMEKILLKAEKLQNVTGTITVAVEARQ